MRLKTKYRPEGNLQVVAGTVIEVNFVTRFQTQSKGSPESFNASCRIECNFCVAGGDGAQSTRNASGHVVIGGGGVDKPNLPGDERGKRPRAPGLQPRRE